MQLFVIIMTWRKQKMAIKTEPLTVEEMQYIYAALYSYTCGGPKKGSPAPSLKKENHIREKLDYIYNKQHKGEK